jgi:NTP pyrophosphatase (non-canonical NTP hydrolase)
MTPWEYQKLAEKTESQDFNAISERMVDTDQVVRLQHAAQGLVTEAGEFTDALKKHLFYGKDLDVTNLAEELGDTLWYVALACNALGTRMDEVMYKNIKKLQTRYPGKFTEEEALHRNLGAERQILEGDVDAEDPRR